MPVKICGRPPGKPRAAGTRNPQAEDAGIVAIALFERMRAGNGILEDRPEGADEDDEDRRQLEGRQDGDRVGNVNRRRHRPGDLGEGQEDPLQPRDVPTASPETMPSSVARAKPGIRMVSDDRVPAHSSGSDSHSALAVISGEGSSGLSPSGRWTEATHQASSSTIQTETLSNARPASRVPDGAQPMRQAPAAGTCRSTRAI
jgi:hypothetical protein